MHGLDEMLEPFLFRQPRGDEETLPAFCPLCQQFQPERKVRSQRLADNFNVQSRLEIAELFREAGLIATTWFTPVKASRTRRRLSSVPRCIENGLECSVSTIGIPWRLATFKADQPAEARRECE